MQGSSCHPASFRSRLSGGGWLSPSFCGSFSRFGYGRFSCFGYGWLSRFGWGRLSRFGCGSFSRFGHGFNRSRQFQLGRFLSPMVAMVQRLDVRSFFFRPQLSFYTVSVFVLKVFWNRFSCHGHSVAELSPPELSNFAHSVTIYEPPRRRLDRVVLPGSHRHKPGGPGSAYRPNW
jgi:hypothetical protein